MSIVINTILFDLDGTLLPMDMDEFMKSFFIEITKKMEPYGYKAEQLKKGLLRCMDAMVKNNGSHTNEEIKSRRLSQR